MSSSRHPAPIGLPAPPYDKSTRTSATRTLRVSFISYGENEHRLRPPRPVATSV